MTNEHHSQASTLKEVIIKFNLWFGYLRSKWLTIAGAGLVAAVLGFVYASYKKKEYVAVSSFVLAESGNGGAMGQYLGLAAMAGIDLGGSGSNGMFTGDNIMELYKSRRMIEKTLLSSAVINGKKQLLIEHYINFNHMRDQWKEKQPRLQQLDFNIPPAKYTRQQDSVVSAIVQTINLHNLIITKPDKKLNIINVQMTATDEQFAKSFNEQIVENVNDFYVQTKVKRSAENVAVLQHQADSIRKELNSAISGVALSLDANPNANPARQVLRVPSQRRQVDLEANKAILTELVKNLELSKLTLRQQTPLIQLIDSPVLPLKMKVLGKVKAALIGAVLVSFLVTVILLLRFMLRGINKPQAKP